MNKNLIDKKEKRIKDAFSVLLESDQGGTLRSNSPGRRYKRRIGSLKTPLKDSKQGLISDWIGKTRKF